MSCRPKNAAIAGITTASVLAVFLVSVAPVASFAVPIILCCAALGFAGGLLLKKPHAGWSILTGLLGAGVGVLITILLIMFAFAGF